MKLKPSSLGAVVGAVIVVVGLAAYSGISNAQSVGADEFASIASCVFNERTGQPIAGATVLIHSAGDTSGIQYTHADGCIGDNLFNVELFRGDFIQAQYEENGKLFTQEFRIPRKLAPREYRWDFHLDLSPRRNNGRGEQRGN